MPYVDNHRHAPCVYFGRCRSTTLIKIGTTCTLRKRTLQHKSKYGGFHVFAVSEGGRDEEQHIHCYLRKDMVPWNGEREWFKQSMAVTDFISASTLPYGGGHPVPAFLGEIQHARRPRFTVPRTIDEPTRYQACDLCRELNVPFRLLQEFLAFEHIRSDWGFYTEADLERLRVLNDAWCNRIDPITGIAV